MKRKILIIIYYLFIPTAALFTQEKNIEAEILLKLDREFDKAAAEKGVEGWIAYFAPNGSMLSDTTMPITGLKEIRKAMEPAFSDSSFSLRWEPIKAEMMIPGVLGYTTGKWIRLWKNKQDKFMKAVGTYSSTWKKQPDGSWKIILDTGNTDEPPEEIK